MNISIATTDITVQMKHTWTIQRDHSNRKHSTPKREEVGKKRLMGALEGLPIVFAAGQRAYTGRAHQYVCPCNNDVIKILTDRGM